MDCLDHTRIEPRLINTGIGVLLQDPGVTGPKLETLRRVLPALIRELAAFRPAVVHLNAAAAMPGFLRDVGFLRIARAFGARTILHVHGPSFPGVGRDEHLLNLSRRVLRRVDRIVVLGNAARQQAHDLGFPQAMSLENFVPIRPARPRRPRGAIRFLFVGWVMQNKGVFELVEALAAVPDVSLVLLGKIVDTADADTEATLRARIADLGVGDRVVLAGEVPHDEVGDFYDAADVFVLPSYSEGLPYALLEAMMAGLAVVTTPVGSIPEVVDDSIGVLVPPRDPHALSVAMRALATDPERVARLGAAARERAIERYSVDAVLGRLTTLYEELAAEGPVSRRPWR
jgi:glycosyltransferase involved in cell wall biosynthesis